WRTEPLPSGPRACRICRSDGHCKRHDGCNLTRCQRPDSLETARRDQPNQAMRRVLMRRVTMCRVAIAAAALAAALGTARTVRAEDAPALPSYMSATSPDGDT